MRPQQLNNYGDFVLYPSKASNPAVESTPPVERAPTRLQSLSDYELELAYQSLRNKCSQYFDTAYDFLDFLNAQACSTKSIGMLSQDDEFSIELVNEYCRRMPRRRQPSSADSFHSVTHSHRSGQYSGYNSERESPPRSPSRASELFSLKSQSMIGQFNSKLSSLAHKEHKCKICDKRFTRLSPLRSHMYTHTREKRE